MKMHEDNNLGILTEWSHKEFISFWDDDKYDVAQDKV